MNRVYDFLRDEAFRIFYTRRPHFDLENFTELQANIPLMKQGVYL